GYKFVGYVSTIEGEEKLIYDADGTPQITTTVTNISEFSLTAEHRHDINKSYILTAQWKANEYAVLFNHLGGIGGELSAKMTFDETPQNITTPTRSGYDFGGYFTEKDGAGEQYFDDNGTAVQTWNIPHDTTLYAHWYVLCKVCGERENDCICKYCDDCDALTFDGKKSHKCLCTFCDICGVNTYLDDCICVYCDKCEKLLEPKNECVCVPDTTAPTTSASTSPTSPIDTKSTAPTNTNATDATPTSPINTSSPTSPTDTKLTSPTSPTDTTPTSPTDTKATSPTGTNPTSPSDTKVTSPTVTNGSTMPTGDTTPTEPQGIKITFEPSNGEPVIVATVSDDGKIGKLPKPERAGYKFVTWAEIRDVGRVTGGDKITMSDGLQVLRFLVNLSSVVKRDTPAWNAALIVSTDKPAMADALQILRYLVKLSNVISDGYPVTVDTVATRDITLTARWAALTPGTPVGFKLQSSARNVELSWSAAAWAEGYEVYRSNERLGEYALVGTITSAALTKFADSGAKSGQWFYCVRAYRTVEGRKLYGEYGEVEGVKVG
ncbi:MAG: InlB B-repeat-containing protein, partial [Oscillospiraceae bacterium]|nr:InlB B-repeat-containing protein [Oscillospiraceae bacterium]